MANKLHQIICSICVCFFTIWPHLNLVDGVSEVSFATCCSAGINATHDMELDALVKKSSADECVAINQVDQIFKEVKTNTPTISIARFCHQPLNPTPLIML